MFLDLVKYSRSYRGYDSSYTFTKEELMSFVECARFAPSSVNVQPLKYYLAYEAEEVAKIQPLTGWAKGLPALTLPHPGKCPTAFIVVCQDTNWGASIPHFQRDVGIVSQTILLAAAEKGLGGCMIGNYNVETVKAALSLSEELTPVLIIALGKPDETIVIVDAVEGEQPRYYRDENDVHYVPKRKLEDIILTK